MVSLVKEYNDCRYTYLASKKQVLLSLSHRTVCCSDYKDSAVHLSSTCNHVFDIVSVTWAVNVSIVTLVCLVLYVSSVDCDTTLSLFRSLIDISIVLKLSITFVCKILCDSSCKSSLTVVNVTDCTNVYMWFGTIKMFFCHWNFLLKIYNSKIVNDILSKRVQNIKYFIKNLSLSLSVR